VGCAGRAAFLPRSSGIAPEATIGTGQSAVSGSMNGSDTLH
jgi:hypothetical protein